MFDTLVLDCAKGPSVRCTALTRSSRVCVLLYFLRALFLLAPYPVRAVLSNHPTQSAGESNAMLFVCV